MSSVQQQARRQQRIDELCAASLRALTGDARLHYRGQRLYAGETRLAMQAPHLRVDSAQDSFADCRAAADGMALRLLHSDAALHRQRCPADKIERLVFELLEQLRVETFVPAGLSGMAANLRQRFERWSLAFYRSGLTDSTLGMLLYTVAQMCWSRLNAWPVLAETEDYIESMRFALASELGRDLGALRRLRHDQHAFAGHALAIAAVVGARVRAEQAAEGGDEDEVAEKTTREFALLLDFDADNGDEDSGIAAPVSGLSKVFEDGSERYRVFTTRYDTEIKAASVVRAALLAEYRERIDRRVAEQGLNLSRLARMLGAALTTPERDGWLFGEEEGQLDGSRLSQLVTSPAERRLFRQPRLRPHADCVVAFLVDCSGSMKGYIEAVAALLDILLRTLEMVDVRTELLGFTTGAWNGGRPYREWMAAGRPPHPGRLNEVCHLVFKDGDRSWRRARRDIAALLKADLFREGIDGEAVDWACNRLLARSEARRILVVVSDGCPADSATGLANDGFYLDNHLKEVVRRRSQQGEVEIIGLGVGLDLSPFYRRCLATDMSQTLDNSLFHHIAQLFAQRHARPG